MIQIYCDTCGEYRKFQSGIQGDYRLWFTTLELRQICKENKELGCRPGIDICENCGDKLVVWTHLDDCLIQALRNKGERNAKKTFE